VTVDTKQNCAQEPVDADNHHLKTAALRAYESYRQRVPNNEQMAEFLPMVRRIAQRVTTYLRPPLSFEDLVSAGTLGLLKAARDFDPSHQAEFETYAYIRIKGAILDELRSLSMLPPALNKQIQNAVGLSRQITQQTGSPPTDEELADKLGITAEKLHKTYESARVQRFISINASAEDTPALGSILASVGSITPDEHLERTELIDRLSEAIQQLPERQRQMILLYYHQELTMKQIAEVFEVTESRVSQLHASALFKLSVKLRGLKDGGQ